MDDEDDGNEVDRRFGNGLSPSCIRGMGIFLGFVLIGAGLVETAERRVCHPSYGFSLYCRTPYQPYLWVNQQYADWLHKPVDRVVGRPIRDVIGKGAFETLLPRFEQVLGGEDVAYQAEATYDKIGPGHISAAYKPTLDSNGKAEGWVALVEDVTEAANEPGDSGCRNPVTET